MTCGMATHGPAVRRRWRRGDLRPRWPAQGDRFHLHREPVRPTGPDLGGAAIRALSQYQSRPVYVSYSTFRGGVCSNGGALSSIGVSWTMLNRPVHRQPGHRRGRQPRPAGTPGGGSGGAIYNDGNTITLSRRHDHHGNSANEGGGAIFFVSNDRTGGLRIKKSTLSGQPQRRDSRPGTPASSTSAWAPPPPSSATAPPADRRGATTLAYRSTIKEPRADQAPPPPPG